MDQWSLIQNAILEPEVRRYMFYNSRAFGIAIAVVRITASHCPQWYVPLLMYNESCPWDFHRSLREFVPFQWEFGEGIEFSKAHMGVKCPNPIDF